jgi:hypothetical protein
VRIPERARYRRISLSELKTSRGETWNDRISSLKLIDLKSMTEVYNAPHECANQILIFGNTHFRGNSMIIAGAAPDLTALRLHPRTQDRWNDRISSLCVPPGRTFTLYGDVGFGGETLVCNGPAFVQILDPMRWNDRASAFQAH